MNGPVDLAAPVERDGKGGPSVGALRVHGDGVAAAIGGLGQAVLIDQRARPADLSLAERRLELDDPSVALRRVDPAAVGERLFGLGEQRLGAAWRRRGRQAPAPGARP